MPMTSAPVLTVVVANSADLWLPEFFDSLIGQAHRDWEAIVVIPDNSSIDHAIAEDYARGDERITIHQFNGSRADSRTFGLARARGRFVNFADPTRTLSADSLGPLVESLIRSDSDLAFSERPIDVRRDRRPIARGVGVTVVTDPYLITRQVDENVVLRTSFLRASSIGYAPATAYPDIVRSARILTSARSIDLVPGTEKPRDINESSEGPDLLGAADWLSQTSDALNVVRDNTNDRAMSTFATALLARELWSLLRRFNQIDDPITLPLLTKVIQRCIGFCGRDSLEALPALQRIALEHAGGGGLERSWRSVDWWLNPYSHRVPSLAYRTVVVAGAIRLLDKQSDEERRLARLLVWAQVLRPLVTDYGPIGGETYEVVLRELARIWSESPDLLEHPDPTGLEQAMRQAAHRLDHGSMREAIRFEKSIGPARVVRVRPAGQDFFIEGTLDSSIDLRPAVTVELVLRSRSSSKVRTRSAWATRSLDSPLVRWHARVPSGVEWQYEDWAVWVRVTDAGVSSRDQPVRHVAVPETLDIGARGSSLRLERSHDLGFAISAIPPVGSVGRSEPDGAITSPTCQ